MFNNIEVIYYIYLLINNFIYLKTVYLKFIIN